MEEWKLKWQMAGGGDNTIIRQEPQEQK